MAYRRLLAVLAAALAIGAGAGAQISSDGGPIYIDSERTESFENERKVVLIGNVEIQQGTARLRSNTVTINFAPRRAGGASGIASGFGEVETMTAEGEVFYITPELKAKSDQAVYDRVSDTITMTGNVALMRERDVAEGETLKMEITNRRTTLDGGTGRARMVIEPSGEPAPAE